MPSRIVTRAPPRAAQVARARQHRTRHYAPGALAPARTSPDGPHARRGRVPVPIGPPSRRKTGRGPRREPSAPSECTPAARSRRQHSGRAAESKFSTTLRLKGSDCAFRMSIVLLRCLVRPSPWRNLTVGDNWRAECASRLSSARPAISSVPIRPEAGVQPAWREVRRAKPHRRRRAVERFGLKASEKASRPENASGARPLFTPTHLTSASNDLQESAGSLSLAARVSACGRSNVRLPMSRTEDELT